ncbi:MAG: hypothetical protein EOP04_28365 [Proteobacteria bacterium]|nr:MAG: hypothetical protein EOP04_28365 [Pseudomonadota bacterium]
MLLSNQWALCLSFLCIAVEFGKQAHSTSETVLNVWELVKVVLIRITGCFFFNQNSRQGRTGRQNTQKLFWRPVSLKENALFFAKQMPCLDQVLYVYELVVMFKQPNLQSPLTKV